MKDKLFIQWTNKVDAIAYYAVAERGGSQEEYPTHSTARFDRESMIIINAAAFLRSCFAGAHGAQTLLLLRYTCNSHPRGDQKVGADFTTESSNNVRPGRTVAHSFCEIERFFERVPH